MATEIRVETKGLRALAATQLGRARCSVTVYPVDASVEFNVMHTDTINPAASTDRARFIKDLLAAAEKKKISKDERKDLAIEAEQLLDLLASNVVARSLEKHSATKDADAFTADAPWDTPVDGAALLDELRAFVLSYLVLPPHAAEAIALWIVHSYLLDVADYTPYVLVTSPVRECGKSTLLELVGQLAYRAKKTDGITAAALYRVIEKHRPTMLLDELDTRLRGDTGELLRGVLNSGFERGGNITICVGDEHETKDFSTYCPKVLAGIGRVWDTVASRSIPIRLNRATKAELTGLKKIRGDRIGALCLPLRRQIVRWTSEVGEQLRDDDPVTPDDLGARQSDVWRPLLAIADAAGNAWPVTAREAAIALHGIAEDEGDLKLLLLEDLQSIFFETGSSVLPSAQIVIELTKREDRPWPEYRDGRPISTKALSDLLRAFGIRPKTKRIPGDQVKGYELSALKPVFAKYLRDPAIPAERPVPPVPVTEIPPPLATDERGGTDGTDEKHGIGRVRAPGDRGEAWEPEDVGLLFAAADGDE